MRSRLTGVGGDARRGRCLQAVPVGAVCVRERSDVPRVDPDEDREWRARQLLGAQVRAHAGAHPQPDAGGHRGQSAEPRGDRPDTETVQVGVVSR